MLLAGETGCGKELMARAAHAKQPLAAHEVERMRLRAGLVEHALGTLKRWFGRDLFRVRGFAADQAHWRRFARSRLGVAT